MSAEAIAGAAYAGFLIVAAIGLDHLARHTHNRSGRFRTQGFRYLEQLDVWECPEGEHLKPLAIDHRSRVARYRARAAVCNSCPAKDGCTDSDQGREVVRQLDPWPHSEAGRFHRGISVALLFLASLIAVVMMMRNTSLPDWALLGPVLAGSVLLWLRMASAFRATRSGFPGEGEDILGNPWRT
jgi:hypothetical protein